MLYMWFYATGMYSNPIFLYEYQPSIAKKHPKEFLNRFNGFLQTDGYSAYNAVEDVTIVGCFAHARKGFTDTFMQDGRLEISNNRAERGIKPFVIGRKNFLFSKSPKGAQASAIVYSVIETAKANLLGII